MKVYKILNGSWKCYYGIFKNYSSNGKSILLDIYWENPDKITMVGYFELDDLELIKE